MNILAKTKALAKAVLGKKLLVSPEIHRPSQRFGSEYGGWNIISEGIDRNSVVYSFGVGEDASFDIALIEEYQLTVHAFDPTPRSIEWVKKQGFKENFVMHEYGISAQDGNVSFNPPENPAHVSHTLLPRPSTERKAISVPVKRLSTIMRELGHNHIHILKMDVEGAEYEVVGDIFRSSVRPDQILVEFHHRFPGVGIPRTRRAIEELRSMGYKLFFVSESGEELCFAR